MQRNVLKDISAIGERGRKLARRDFIDDDG
jgi:hypothetical protein